MKTDTFVFKRMQEKITAFMTCIALIQLAALTECTINNDMFEPKIYINRQILITRMQTAAHRFAISSSDSNYELSGQVYESQQKFNNQSQVYDILNYKKSSSCTYFKSLIQMNTLQGESFQDVSLQSIVKEETNTLFVISAKDDIDNQKFVKVYRYDSGHFAFQTQIDFRNTTLNQNIDFDIHLTSFDGSILFSDGNYMYQLQDKFDKVKNITEYTWVQIKGLNVGINLWKSEEFLGFQSVTYQEKQLFLLLYTQKIVFYEYFQSQKTVKPFVQIVNSGSQFQDVQIGENTSQLYAIKGKQLYLYDSKNLQNPIKHQLAGQSCSRIYLFHSTVHVICQFEKRNFVAEYFYNDTLNVLILNRFYNEIENYRLLEYINNFFLMIGENQIILTSNGVNRKILLDMPRNAYSERFVSFGIQKFHVLKQLDQQSSSQQILAVGQDFIVLLKLKFTPAQVWCYIQRPPLNLQTNILVVRNTSKCELNEKKQTLKSICVNLQPVQILFQHYQIESRVTTIFVVLLILLIFALVFLCSGCVFRENRNYNNLIGQIKQKIKKIKNKAHQLKEI